MSTFNNESLSNVIAWIWQHGARYLYLDVLAAINDWIGAVPDVPGSHVLTARLEIRDALNDFDEKYTLLYDKTKLTKLLTVVEELQKNVDVEKLHQGLTLHYIRLNRILKFCVGNFFIFYIDVAPIISIKKK